MKKKTSRVALLGPPNVGKSLLFNLLCRQYTIVSNYPGTTIELSRGRALLGKNCLEVVDTPGTYTLNAVSEEEKLTCKLLLQERLDLIVQVADARNLPRMLNLTAELVETGIPLILVVNLMDEANRLGIRIKTNELSRKLGIPVVAASMVAGDGVEEVKNKIKYAVKGAFPGSYPSRPRYPLYVQNYVQSASAKVKKPGHVAPEFVALASLHPDTGLSSSLFSKDIAGKPGKEGINAARAHHMLQEINMARRQWSKKMLKGVYLPPLIPKTGHEEKISQLMVNPVSGTLILLLVLYFGLYQFVGVWSAGYLVDYLDGYLFGELIIPQVEKAVHRFVPFHWLQELFSGPYGLITLGLRYTFAIILPIVFSFFLVFSFIEDSGYLPRMAYLLNNLVSKIGLNGKAVIPLALGLGCGTLAVLVTRTLETRRERMLTALLLSLAVPCSAQLALIMALLAGSGAAIWVWLLAVLFVFAGVSYTANRVTGGVTPPFCMEIPPLRRPGISSIFRKTAARTRWYLVEVLPMFLVTSLLIWGASISGFLSWLVQLCHIPLQALGLPEEISMVLIMGFVRRDYGAAGLFELTQLGILSPVQVLITGVVLTLFLPCVAQLIVLIREQGLFYALIVIATSVLVSWSAGYIIYCIYGIMYF